MGRHSLYNAFGDNHAMFLHALADFRRTLVEGSVQRLKEPGAGVAEIRVVLDGLAAVGATPPRRPRLGSPPRQPPKGR